ncbi:MAG: hypothetical protein K0S16_2295, partial [Moraxellaceae bacterium]|nr:hypothetical protein [Moraxellaceae bacterium]
MPSATTSRTSASLLAGLTLLAGCNGGGDGAPQATTISGTAAVGAPLSAATIDLRCQGGATATLMTEADGDWSYTVPSSQLPCAVRASGGVA